MKNVTTSGHYRVIDDDEVLLTVTIGEAQIGGSAVVVHNAVLEQGSINRLHLGTGRELRGTTVRVTTTVADINPHTNNTSVTYYFEGGIEPSKIILTSSVDYDLGSMMFEAYFDIV